MQTINKTSVLKIFYYLMAIDGTVTGEEKTKFDEIGTNFLGDDYSVNKESILEECNTRINAVDIDDELYDVLQEAVDEVIAVKSEKRTDGILPRHLLWNMLVIAHSDGDYSEIENRLISHVARVLGVEKSVLLEMKQMIISANAVQEELAQLNNSNKPYNEIRPIVEEIERRKQALFEAVTALIEDEKFFAEPEPIEKQNALKDAGKKISEAVAPKAKEIGKRTQKSAKAVSGFLGEKASQGAEGLKAETSKLFSKMKDITKK